MKKWLLVLVLGASMNGCISEDDCDDREDAAFERGKAAIQKRLDYCHKHIICINLGSGTLTCDCQES